MINIINDKRYSNLNNNILRLGLDYIELNISSSDTFDFIKGFVKNSPFRFKNDFVFSLDDTGQKNKSISIFYKDTKIASIFENIFNNGKNGLYLTFYGTFFNFDFYSSDLFYKLLDIIGFKYNYIDFLNLYRFDFCVDIQNLTVDSIYNSLDLLKIKEKNISIRKNSHTNEMTWFMINYDDYSVRVYNKKLDIKDKGLDLKSSLYKNYLNNNNYITRIEIVLKRKQLKKYKIKDYKNIELYGYNKLINFLNKYLYTNFPNFTQKLEKTELEIEKDLKKEFEFNKKMFLSYYEKLKDNKNGKSFLKGKFLLTFGSDFDVFN